MAGSQWPEVRFNRRIVHALLMLCMGRKTPVPAARFTTFHSQKNAQVKRLKINGLFQMEIS
jgi:hypothetical protein